MAVWKIADTQAVLTLKAAHTRRRQKKPSGNGGAATETATSWSSDQPIQIFFTTLMNAINQNRIKKVLETFCDHFTGEFILIGDWALHSYSKSHPLKELEIDAIVSYAAEGTLNDSYIVTKNPRMKKSQFICEAGCDIDLYVERQHGLRIPFSEIQAYSQQIDRLRVASPEHLLLLKLDAYKDRKHTPKGTKDKEDILSMLAKVPLKKKEIFDAHLDEEDKELLKEVLGDKEIAMTLCNQNTFEAKQLRSNASKALKELTNEKPRIPTQKLKDPSQDLQ